MKRKLLIIALVWLTMSTFTYSALFADHCAIVTKFHDMYDSDATIREDMGMSMLFALFPPFWIASPFVTGFYYYGWIFTPQQCRDLQHDEKWRTGGS